jgi:hypothetical protein
MIRYPVVRILRQSVRVPDFILRCIGFLGEVLGDEFDAQATVLFVAVRSGVQYASTVRSALRNRAYASAPSTISVFPFIIQFYLMRLLR